jgi:hypothetical protein
VTTGVISVAFGGVLATLSLLRAVRVVAGGGGDVGGFGCAWRCPGGESGNVPPAWDTPECKRREEYAESEGNYCCCRRRYLRICYFLGLVSAASKLLLMLLLLLLLDSSQ